MASGAPDYNNSTIIKGKYGDTRIPVLLDEAGNLVALIKGDYEGTLTSIAVDENGIMKANISAQDLANLQVDITTQSVQELIVKPTISEYGDEQAPFNKAGYGTINAGANSDLIDYDVPAGKKIKITGGFVTCDAPGLNKAIFVAQDTCGFTVYFDTFLHLPVAKEGTIIQVAGGNLKLTVYNELLTNQYFYCFLWGVIIDV